MASWWSRIAIAEVSLGVIFASGCGGMGSMGSTSGTSSPVTASGEWTWVSGSNAVEQNGSYGSLGVAASTNTPGARSGGVGWTDTAGNLWLFGGRSAQVGGQCRQYDPLCTAGTNAWFNDLWKYSNGQWTWMGGSDTTDQPGVYGTMGTAASTNTPGARYGAVSWTDGTGDFWLFGGNGYDAQGNAGELNDLWRYHAGQWTWMGGANHVQQAGVYGQLGVAGATNYPGSRAHAVGAVDAAGDFWLFGGKGCDGTGNCFFALNDLWKYSGGEWTWMGGTKTASPGLAGVYGTEGVGAPGNMIGGRYRAAGWMDGTENLWIFGGAGYDDSNYNIAELDDFWQFGGGKWTWMGGPANQIDVLGIYGSEGVGAAANIPGSRDSGMTWTDNSGNLWFFGGEGFGSTYTSHIDSTFNDLWRYSNGQWTWMSGYGVEGQPGSYGTEGKPAAANVPGSRRSGVTWTDAAGRLWLFGGMGVGSQGKVGYLNDLWVYQP